MTDPLIEEIYLIVEAALQNASAVPVHIFPFRMSDERLQSEQDSPHHDFWQNLRPDYDFFEKYHQVPAISLLNGLYHVN
jgi:murein L,D-transpeptidase YafK